MIKKIIIITVLCFPYLLFTQSISDQDTEDIYKNKKKQYLKYSLLFGVGYQSFIYYDLEDNSASENFLTLNFTATYYPFSFLGLSYQLGVGLFSYYNITDLELDLLRFFPNNVARTNIENNFNLYWFQFFNNDSLFYLSTGFSYVYTGTLRSQNTSTEVVYKDSNKHLIYLRLALGAQLALYNHTIMDVQLYILKNFGLMNSWANMGDNTYKQLVIGVQVGFGYFD